MFRKLSMIVCALVLTFPLASCDVVRGGGFACTTKGDRPHESKGSPGYIVSKGKTKCTGNKRPAKVTVTLQIQRKKLGKWRVLRAATRKRVYPNPQLGKTYVLQNRSLTCRKGKFRTRVRIVGGGKSVIWKKSAPKTNPCG